MSEDRYYRYASYLKSLYGEKVYKLPVNLPVTCPNRLEGKGCSFCSDLGTGFESLNNKLSVREQLLKNKTYIKKRYNANKFIAYFQNYTNTFLPLETFEAWIQEAANVEDIVEIAISTRPDCVREDYLQVLRRIKETTGREMTIELGLQTVNYHSLDRIHRGHSLAEYVQAVMLIKSYGYRICTHLILNLPWDKHRDVIENAKMMSALSVDQVKLHSLYVAKNTELAEAYLNEEIVIGSKEDYIERVIVFLEYLKPDIAIERVLSRAPEEETYFCNWNTSWWKIKDEIVATMEDRKTYQGKKYNYLNGSGLVKGCY